MLLDYGLSIDIWLESTAVTLAITVALTGAMSYVWLYFMVLSMDLVLGWL